MTVSVCVPVSTCPRTYLRKYTSDLYQILVHVTYGRGSVLLWRRRHMLFTSGFMDDVILANKLKASQRGSPAHMQPWTWL